MSLSLLLSCHGFSRYPLKNLHMFACCDFRSSQNPSYALHLEAFLLSGATGQSWAPLLSPSAWMASLIPIASLCLLRARPGDSSKGQGQQQRPVLLNQITHCSSDSLGLWHVFSDHFQLNSKFPWTPAPGLLVAAGLPLRHDRRVIEPFHL